MAIPDYQQIMLPLLQHTADGEIHTARDLKEPLADHFALTPEERALKLPSGQQTYFHNRLAWAKTYLERAGILQNVRRGHFTITDRGREILRSGVSDIDNSFLLQYVEFTEFLSRSKPEMIRKHKPPRACRKHKRPKRHYSMPTNVSAMT